MSVADCFDQLELGVKELSLRDQHVDIADDSVAVAGRGEAQILLRCVAKCLGGVGQLACPAEGAQRIGHVLEGAKHGTHVCELGLFALRPGRGHGGSSSAGVEDWLSDRNICNPGAAARLQQVAQIQALVAEFTCQRDARQQICCRDAHLCVGGDEPELGDSDVGSSLHQLCRESGGKHVRERQVLK